MPWNDTNKYTVNHFKPAIYAKSYFDRIFANAGFTYDWQNIASTHFDKLLIPYNGDVNNFDYTDYRVKADTTFTSSYSQPTIGLNDSFTQQIVTWTETLDAQNLFNPTTGEYIAPFNSDVTQGQTYNFNFTYSYEILLDNTSAVTAYLLGAYRYNLVFQISVNGFNVGWVEATDKIQISGYLPPYTYTIPTGITSILNASGTTSYPIPVRVYAGDVIEIRAGLRVFDVQGTAFKGQWSNGSGTGLQVNPQVDFSALSVDITPSNNIQIVSGTQIVNEFIPQKIKQSDFVKAIFQMYNLYAYPNTNQPNELILVSRDEWYDAGAEKDWSLKLAKDREQQLIFLPDLTNKKLKLTYKEDKDSANAVYTQATAEIYGQLEYTFQNEYVKDTDVKELLFSPTPVNRTSFDAYLPMINGIAPNTNIRILYDAGNKTCQPFNIYTIGTTGVTGLTSYPQTGHFNDALTPTFDLNFGVCDYYFYQTSVLTNNNLYNLYWRRTVNQINVGRMLVASFHLNEADVQTLKLNDKIRIDNSWWNINKVIDYNANDEVLTTVELISVDTEIDLADFEDKTPIYAGDNTVSYALESARVAINEQSNVNLSQGTVAIYGKGNVVGENLQGIVVGDELTVSENGITTTNLTVTETINGSLISEVLPTYKKYVATISQTGTNDPTVTVLENTIGDIVWTRAAIGEYEGTLTSAFPANKTSLNLSGVYKGSVQGIRRNDNIVSIYTTSTLTITEDDNYLDETFLEIRVYP